MLDSSGGLAVCKRVNGEGNERRDTMGIGRGIVHCTWAWAHAWSQAEAWAEALA